jgi:Xaa-Pro aminopeptidase
VLSVDPGLARSELRARAARERLLPWVERTGLPALVLTRPGPVSWLTGGLPPPVDRSAGTDLVWAVVTGSAATLITTEVEADRIRAEYRPDQHGFAGVVAVPWYDPDAFIRAAAEVAGAPPITMASDGHPAFGTDASDDLTELRLALSAAEQEDLRALGADAAQALEGALAAWSPGQRDLDIQARVAAHLEARGADTPVLIVGGDGRVRRYRHPMAAGEPVYHLAMAVVVARRSGLHAAATRFACAGPLDAELRSLRDRVRQIERDTLAANRPGSTYGDVLTALDRAYARVGAEGGWAGHYQGGPIGYAQREFEIAPSQQGSRWPAARIEPGHAVAWNPSLPGGAKAEDTYLVHASGLERVTTGPDWPTVPGDDGLPPRPAILEVAR